MHYVYLRALNDAPHVLVNLQTLQESGFAG